MFFFRPKGLDPTNLFLVMYQMHLILKISMMIINKKFLVLMFIIQKLEESR